MRILGMRQIRKPAKSEKCTRGLRVVSRNPLVVGAGDNGDASGSME